MFDSIIQDGYWYMFMQVIVTLLLFPIVSFKRFSQIANAYCDAYYPSAKVDTEKYKAASLKILIAVSSVCLLVGMTIVLHATINSTELLNWDNQAGLSVLFLLAMFPVATMAFVQKGLFGLLKKHGGSKRSASLSPQKWQDYYSKPLLLVLIGGQFLFIGTVNYFANHPFDGFAGYGNLLGLLFIDAIFAAISYVIYYSKKMGVIQASEQRYAIKVRAIQFNSIIWIIAIYHLSLSMWIAGLELEEFKLVMQSFYLQLVIFLTAYTISLPKPLANKEPS